MKMKMSAFQTYIITVNFLFMLYLSNMMYRFVSKIESILMGIKYQGEFIEMVSFQNFTFSVHTDSETYEAFCHPLVFMIVGLSTNLIFYIVVKVREHKAKRSFAQPE